MKKAKKVLKPQQKMTDEAMSRNVGAVSREPEKLYRLTPELDLMASHALGHNNNSRTVKVEAPGVVASDSILGALAEDDGGWNPAEYVRADIFDDDDEEEEEASGELAEQAVLGQSVRGQLVLGSIVTAKHPRWGDDCFHAEVRCVPEVGATGAGSRSCTLRWLDEVGGEGSGIFEYESRKPWDKEEAIALTKVQNTAAQLHPRTGPTGQKQWLTDEALAAADSSTFVIVTPVGSASTPAGMPVSSCSDDASNATTATAATTATSSAKPGSADATIDTEKVVLRKRKQNRQQMVSSSYLLSSSPTEWLNDSHVNSVNALSPLPTAHRIRFNLSRGSNVENVLASTTVRRALTDSLGSPLAALVQNYVSEAHWPKLIVCYAEKVLYYNEPYGCQWLTAAHRAHHHEGI